jgi:hypothetical protein
MNHPRRLRTVFAAVLMALTVAVGSSVFAGPASAAPAAVQDDVGTLTSEVTGTFTDANGQAGTFTGTFTPSQFSAVGDELQSSGTLAGNLVSADGTTQSVSQSQTFAVTDLNPIGCQVLDLVLAPLDLDLLGLVVHLDRVHLNITAVPGAGNLLGNLLCAIVGLLDGPGAFAQIAALLNQILALLGL